MGAILGRFRKKKSTFDKLEELDKDIKCIEKYRFRTQQMEKKIVGQFIVFSALLYIVAVVVYYYMFFPKTTSEQIFYIMPLLLVPFLIWFIKKVLTWYYKKKISKNELKLSRLVQEKKRLIEQVMDTETYKVAKTILEKFAPENTISSSVVATPQFKLSNTHTLRQRPVLQKTPIVPNKTSPVKALLPQQPYSSTPIMSMVVPSNGQRGGPSMELQSKPNMPNLPRDILPRNRSALDKMVEYLVGDGPNNRYALICKNCQCHNGMALREEFEYLSFRCCYCMTFNPSRKLRPSAPKLEEDLLKRRISIDKSSSDSEKISDQSDEEESDKEAKKRESLSASENEHDIDKDDKPIDPTISIEKIENDNKLSDKESDKEK